MTYTYEQVLTYEVARDLINTHIADVSASLADEKIKDKPSAKRLAKLRHAQTELVVERRKMDMRDDQDMKKVFHKYRREFCQFQR